MSRFGAALFDLGSDVAIVTGGATGLGKAEAQALAAAGAAVAIVDIDLDEAVQTAGQIESSGGTGRAFQADVTELDEFRTALDAIVNGLGVPTILLNNAGISVLHRALDFTETDFDRQSAVNLKALFFVAQQVARLMARNGGGKVVNFSSVSGQVVDGPRASVYGATKAGIAQLTKYMACEWAPFGIRVNAVAPGQMRTAMARYYTEDPEWLAVSVPEKIPLGRVGEPSDICGPVLFLASDASAFVTGQTLNVDGGWTLI